MRLESLMYALWIALAPVAALAADDAHIAREKIEWCDVWIADADATSLPRVLLIGDSITRGYYNQVADNLKGKACVARLATSKSLGDPALLAEVSSVLGQCKFDVVHFNNGLHGWGYSEEEYKKSFPDLISEIRKNAKGAKLIWATTTPMRMRGKLEEVNPQTDRVKARNKIAAEIVASEKIPTDDLFALVENHPEYSSADGVHFNAKGIAAQSAQAAKSIQEQLK
ncbi:MAG: SGNH/GDSL hydrolase family protein [Candidatus Sumerlaeota bacterium]|nr:SGNH/GDSL hydrolase family protein [Candidatus Sumerlaeota bacterium]